MSNKMVGCKTCGAEIAENAKSCPSCGAKNKKPIFKKWWFWTIIVVILLIAIGSGGSDEPQKIGDVGSPSPSPTQTVSAQKEFGIGEIVDLSDIVVTLVDVSENTGSQFLSPTDGNTFVVCEFEIANNSSKDITVSSLLCFDAYVDDYATSLSLSATISVDKPQLDGTIAAGKKMRGVVGYEVPSDWSEVEIRFTPDFWSGKDITFIASK